MSEFFEYPQDESQDLNDYGTNDQRSDNLDIPNFFSDSSSQNQSAVSDGEVVDLFSFSSAAAEKNEKKMNHRQKRKRRLLMTILSIFLVGVITFSVVIGAFLLYFFTMVDTTVDEFNLNDLEALFTTIIYVDNGKGGYKEYKRLQGDNNCIWVEYDHNAASKNEKGYRGIPQNMVNAVVAIEDKRFYQHQGTDWKRTFSAFANMFLHFYASNQGGSTVTQQLVKNLTLDDQQNASRKIREIMNARYLEEHYSKDVIMECYLNQIALGHNIKGVQVAANYYFNKKVNNLTLAECATIAGITKNPSLYSPDLNEEESLKRRNTVLSEMYNQGYITKEEYKSARDEELKVVCKKSMLAGDTVNSYFIDGLIDDITKQLAKENDWDSKYASRMLYNGGYKIYATVDPEIQSKMEAVYKDRNTYGLVGSNGTKMQSAMTIVDYKGNVRGIVGGIGKKKVNRSFNRATSAIRQPGSSIKPLSVYSACMDNNDIYYSMLIQDLSKNYGEWRVANYGNMGGHGANVSIKYALEQSLNTVPVKLLDEKLGLETSYEFMTKSLGFTTLTPGGNGDLNLAPLGMGGTNGGLTTLESAAAYAIFGNHGFYYEPHFYTKVLNSHGEPLRNEKGEVILNRENARGHYVIAPDSADVMNHLLQNVVKNGTATMIKSYFPKMAVYGKTGTTNDECDLWFCGGTPYYVASCWCGYDNTNNQKVRIPDTNIAKKLWGTIMSSVHSDLSNKQFEDCSDVVEAYYCKSSGLIASSGCSKELGWFRSSNVPAKCTRCGGGSSDASDSKPNSNDKKNNSSQNNSKNSSNTNNGGTSSGTQSTTDNTPSTVTPSETPASSVPPQSTAPAENPTGDNGGNTQQPTDSTTGQPATTQ